MGLDLPVVSVTPGPTYASDNNEAFETIDAHDHTTGKGVPIVPNAIDINADLPFNGHDATELRSVRLESQASALATGSDVGCLSNVAGNPTWNDNSGTATRAVNVSYPMVAGDLPYASSTTAFGKLGIGTTGQTLKVAGGLPTWASPSATLSVTTTTTTFTFSATDDVVLCSTTASAYTGTLPVSTGGGKVYKVKKTVSDFYAITIARAAADVIVDSGASVTSTTLDTVGEEIEIVDAAAGTWQVLSRRIPSIWIAYTPTGNWTTNSTYTGFWRRVGDSMQCRILVTLAGAPDATAFDVAIANATAYTIATAKQPATSTGIRQAYGTAYAVDGAVATYLGVCTYNGTTKVAIAASQSGSGLLFSQAIPFTFGNGDFVVADFTVPITGWNG
jgi:hypothetical protein